MQQKQALKDTGRTIDNYFGKPTSFEDERNTCWNMLEAAHKKYERLRSGCSDEWTKYALEYREDNKLPLIAKIHCLEGTALYVNHIIKEAHYCRNRTYVGEDKND